MLVDMTQMIQLEQIIKAIDEASENGRVQQVVRPPYLAERVVFVDGLPGCGKTMLSPIVGALPRVELLQYAYEIEYMCALKFLNRVEDDAAVTFIRMMTDLCLYNVMMARETNFRPSDLSGVFMNARPLRYLKRLFQKGDAHIPARIKSEQPILHLTTHNLLGYSQPIFEALKSRVTFIEVVRHPLYMIRQQALYTDRYGNDVRDFTICHKHNGSIVPYFAAGWEDLFLQSSGVNRVIYSIKTWQHLIEKLKQKWSTVWDVQVITIPFERFVLEPWPYMRQIEEALGTQVDKTTTRMMKKQRVPRDRIAAGHRLKIYEQYGWRPPLQTGDERQELVDRRADAAQQASDEAMETLDQLSATYEATYWPELSNLS